MNIFRYEGMKIFWIGHDSFKLKYGNLVLYLDPFAEGDYSEKADYVLVSHKHYDHCDYKKIKKVLKDNTVVIASESCQECLEGIDNVLLMKEYDTYEKDIAVSSYPAYNINKPYHPRGLGLSYVIDINGIKIYFAGDTDLIPEMKEAGENGIDIALIPISGIYVMNEKEALESLELLKPKIVIPMHYNYLEGLEKDPYVFKEMVEEKYENIKVVVL